MPLGRVFALSSVFTILSNLPDLKISRSKKRQSGGSAIVITVK